MNQALAENYEHHPYFRKANIRMYRDTTDEAFRPILTTNLTDLHPLQRFTSITKTQ